MTDPAWTKRTQALSFGSQASAYDRGRPDYPDALVAWLIGDARRVADVGAGTGKLARTIRRLGRDVTAVEPDADMRAQLEASTPGVAVLEGTGEHLPLPDASVDAVTYGQAWHWVEPAAGCREAGRVLTDGGVLGLVWNVRDEDVDWVAEMSRIMGASTGETMARLGEPPFGTPFQRAERRDERWTLPLTREGVFDLVNSRSPVIRSSEERRGRITDGITELLDTHPALAGRGVIEMPYVTSGWRLTR